MRNPITDRYILIVDTDQYSGNFERQLCAYATGTYGECGVGQELAERVIKHIKYSDWWQQHIIHTRDNSNDIKRPVCVEPTPGWFNNGVGFNFLDIPENYPKAIDHAVDYMSNYNKVFLDLIRLRIKNQDFDDTWTIQACERELKNAQQRIDDAKKLCKYTAYMSVGISVDTLPPEPVWQEFVQRCYEFFNDESPKFKNKSSIANITGFRRRQQVTFDID